MRIYIKLIFIFLSVTLHAWDSTTVDVGVNFGNISQRSIALDSSGVIHGVYGGRQLYHKQGISTEVIDATIGSGKYPSLVIDSSDTIHIVYGTDSNLLKCAIGTFGNYQIYTVETGVSAGEQYYSIDVNSSGVTHIVYIKSHTLKHAWYDGAWHHEVLISSNVQATTSIVIDSNDNIHISYAVSGTLKYIAKIGSTWVGSDIDTSGYSDVFSAIAVDSNNDIYVAYLDTNANELKIAKKSGTTWNSVSLRSALDTTGWAPSLSIEGTTCYISFRESDATHKYIKYVVYDGSSTSSHDVAEISIYGLSSIAVLNGTVYVLYNSDSSTIKRDGSEFAKASDMGHDIAVDSDSNGYLHVSYIDSVSKILHYATNSPSGTWHKQQISSASNVAETAIVVDQNNFSHICFYDRLNKDLKYATDSSGSWSVETVDSAGNIGGSDGVCDIDFNSNNGVHISYYDSTHTKLKHANKGSGAWQLYDVISGSDKKYNTIAISKDGNTVSYDYAKDYVNMAIDNNDVLHRSYFFSGFIYYRSTLENHQHSVNGNHSRIAVDDAQNAYISFYDTDTHDAKLLSNATGIWQLENVATSGDVGQYASVTMSGDDKVNVCYHNGDNQSLECATKTLDTSINALSSFYYAMNGDKWIDSTNWFSGDKCSWYGVACIGDDIYSIELTDNNLSGELPKELKNLNNQLSSLILKGNHLNNISAVAELTSLRGLDIRDNDITDISALSNLTNLLELYLSNNNLGSLEAIKNLNLTYLYADNINLTALPHFSAMSLYILSLTDNDLTNLLGIEGVSQIYELYLSDNDIIDISALSTIDSLTSIDLFGNQHLSDISPLSNSINLHSLNIAHTKVSDLSPIINFPDLTFLHVGSKRAGVSDLAPLTNLTKMSDLSLWLNDTVTNLSAFSGMSKMDTLFLHGGTLQDLSPLVPMSRIVNLTLQSSNIRNISLLKNLTKLEELNIEQNYIRDISVLSDLSNHSLHSVYLEGNCIRDFSPVNEVANVYGASTASQRDPGECMAFMPSVIMYLLN